MKEISFAMLTFMRWGSYFLSLSIVQHLTLHFWPDTKNPSWWATMLGALFMAVAIPVAYGRHKTRKVFIQDTVKAADGAKVSR